MNDYLREYIKNNLHVLSQWGVETHIDNGVVAFALPFTDNAVEVEDRGDHVDAVNTSATNASAEVV